MLKLYGVCILTTFLHCFRYYCIQILVKCNLLQRHFTAMWVSVFGPFVFPKLHRDCFLVLDGSVTVNNGAGKSIGEVGKWFSRCRKLCGGHVRLNTFYFGSANKTKNVFIINNRNFVRIQTPATPQDWLYWEQKAAEMTNAMHPANSCSRM